MMVMNCYNLIEINTVGQEFIENLKCDEDKDMESDLTNIFPAFKIELEKQMNETEDLSPILLAMEMQVLFLNQAVLIFRTAPYSGWYTGGTDRQHILCPDTDNMPGDSTGHQGGEDGGGGVGGGA